MNCLCCGKPLSSEDENKCGWHKKCIKAFFGTSKLPEIEIDEKVLEKIATESTGKGYTVPGVQKKLSLHLFSENGISRLTVVNFPTGYILKPQVDDFIALPESEQLVMSMADLTGIETVPHALIKGKTGYAYITKRVDRIFNKKNVEMLGMEDFCQLDLRLTQDKYKGSYERCANVIERYSSNIGLNMAEFYMRVIFCFVTGNSDMHLKNFSLIETQPGSSKYKLSPAYDLVPVNVIMPEDTEEVALALNGKKNNLRRKDFLLFADNCNLNRKSAEKMIDKVISLKDKYIKICNDSLIPNDLKQSFVTLIEKRCERLKGNNAG